MHTNQAVSKYPLLLENLKALETERTQINGEGNVLFDCWLAASKPAGTARTNKLYWQLRSRKAQFSGKKSKYIKASEVGLYEAAITRGKKIKELDREISALYRQLNRCCIFTSSAPDSSKVRSHNYRQLRQV